MEPFTISEQIRIVALEAQKEFQTVLMYVSIFALAAMAVWFFLAKVLSPAWGELRRFVKLSRIQQFVLGVCVIGFIQYGATKPTWHISFDGGIKQNPIQPSNVTNDLVSIHWTRDASGGTLVPETATVYVDYKLTVDTNGVWETLAETTVGAWGWSGVVQNATNYDYNVWAYYIPPEPVHTNGVWIYKTLKDRGEKFPIPLRARIEVNGKAISTPKEKRKDEEND